MLYVSRASLYSLVGAFQGTPTSVDWADVFGSNLHGIVDEGEHHSRVQVFVYCLSEGRTRSKAFS